MSQIRASQIRATEISSNHRELHGAIFGVWPGLQEGHSLVVGFQCSQVNESLLEHVWKQGDANHVLGCQGSCSVKIHSTWLGSQRPFLCCLHVPFERGCAAQKWSQLWRGNRFFIQHDGAPVHRSNLVINFFHATNTKVVSTPTARILRFWFFPVQQDHAQPQGHQISNSARPRKLAKSQHGSTRMRTRWNNPCLTDFAAVWKWWLRISSEEHGQWCPDSQDWSLVDKPGLCLTDFVLLWANALPVTHFVTLLHCYLRKFRSHFSEMYCSDIKILFQRQNKLFILLRHPRVPACRS